MWAIVVAAGRGLRFGGAKQFRMLGGRPVVDWAVHDAARWADGVVVVLPEALAVGTDAWSRLLANASQLEARELLLVPGGATRSESVRCGLARVPDRAQVVLVHDGARPLAGERVFQRVIAAVRGGADAAIPTIDVTDTIRWRRGAPADRQGIVAVQTPQGFRADALRAAHAAGAEATDDATLVEAMGGKVVTVDGDSRNLKITAAHDLAVAEALLTAGDGMADVVASDAVARGDATGSIGDASGSGDMADSNDAPASGDASDSEEEAAAAVSGHRVETGDHPNMDARRAQAAAEDPGLRVGQGFDVHRYSDDPGRALVLGGQRFEDERGLEGHSDADVAAHVCIEALLAAAGLGDIGQFFSDSDPRWADADSVDLLSRAAAAVRDAGWNPVNVSCTVVLDAPKIAPRRDAMEKRLSQAAGAPVAVTGRRTEGVGALGRGEGVAAWAVALVYRRHAGAESAGS